MGTLPSCILFLYLNNALLCTLCLETTDILDPVSARVLPVGQLMSSHLDILDPVSARVLPVGQLMSSHLDIQKLRILNTMSRWRCDMLPHVGFCMVVNVNLCVECGLKMF